MAEGPIQGLSIGLGLDTSGIDQGLKALKGKLKLANSEMAANMSAFDRGEKSVGKYQTQLDGLNRKLGVQKAAVNAARSEYERMVAQHGEGSRQAERAATAYNTEVAAVNNLERHVGALTTEFREFEEQQEASNSAFGRLSSSLETYGGKVSKFGDGMKTVGTGMTAGITAPLLGVGAAAIKMADQSQTAQGKLQAQLGISEEEAGKLADTAENLWKNAFGESVEEVAESLSIVKRNMQDLPIDQIEKVAEKGYILQDAFGIEMASSTKTAQTMMTNFGISADEAFDLMTRGIQEGGDYSDELLDTLNEYSPQFSTMGHSAEDMMNILVAGAEAGAFSLDKVGDAVKEFNIRAKDGSDTTAEGFEAIGLNAGEMGDAIAEGGDKGKRAFEATIAGLAAMKDPVEQTAAGVALFGGTWEDLESDVIKAMGTTVDKLGTVEGATAKAGEALYDNFGSRMTSMWRDFQTSLMPAGEILLEVAEDVLPKVSDGLEKLTGWFTAMEPAGQRTAVAIAGIAAAAGPVIVGLGFMVSAVGGIMTAVAPLAAAIAGAGGLAASFGVAGTAVMAFATGPVGIAIAAIAGIGIGVGLLVNHMRKDAIPEVDRFGEGVSESTQKALGSFFELSDGAALSLAELRINGLDVTTEMAEELVAKYDEMNGKILESMTARHSEEIEQMKTFFANSSTLTEEEEAKAVALKQNQQDAELKIQQFHEDEIQRILEGAAKEKRELTASELAQIDNLHKEMNESAVVYLSANEMEQKVIMERMAATAGEMSARQAAEVTKNSADARDKVIEDANTKYDDVVAMAIRERDETGTITAEQATKIIAEATKTKDSAVKNAEDMHSGVVEEAKLQAGEHVDEVDWETGEILSKWDMYKKGVLETFRETNEESLADFKRWGTDFDAGWNTFNTKAQEKVNAWKKGVKDRMKESFSDTKRDFTKWGSDFDTNWNTFNNKARAKADEYKAGVKKRFRDTNADTLADFKRWGGNIKDWASDAKDSIMKTFDNLVTGAKNLPGRIGSGISSMASKVSDGVKKVSNKLASGLGTGVNGVIGGINWVLGKIGVTSEIKKWEVPKYAMGTHAHPGGMAILGDGRGSNAGRELIKTPSGELGLSPGTDTLMNLPKGTEVLSAKKTRELLGDVPKYANGIGDLWKKAKNFGGNVKDAAFNVWDHVSNPSKLLSTALSLLGISAPTGGSFVGNMAKGGYNKVKGGAVGYLKNKIDNSGTQAGSGQGFGPGFRLTSRRGFRINPVTGIGQMHQGDDWGARAGALIAAQAAGKVIEAGYHGIRGNYVRVKSGIMDRLYQHNQRNMVSVGQNVRKGQAIGTVGSTGRSTGPHLHYEVRRNGFNINPAGLATGGVTNKEQFVRISEGDREEITIPMHPSRRTDAMKLLALAGRKLMPGNDKGITRPNQLPNVGGGSEGNTVLQALLAATMKQNEILMQLLNKDANVYMDSSAVVGVIGDSINTQLGGSSRSNAYMRGERL